MLTRHAVVSLLHSWWMPTPRCRRWLDNPFYRSYGVLTMCRMRYTLQYGVIVSKAMTARRGASGTGREMNTVDRSSARLRALTEETDGQLLRELLDRKPSI
jgi:hypothetical protein